MNFRQIILLCSLSSAGAFQNTPVWNTVGLSSTTTTTMLGSNNNNEESSVYDDRRSFMNSVLAGAAALTTAVTFATPANAGIDPSLLKGYSVEGDVSGSAQRLRQIEEIQRPASDTLNIPYEKLPSGVEYREYREGKGDAGV